MNDVWQGIFGGFGAGLLVAVAFMSMMIHRAVEFGKTRAFKEGRDSAIDSAAMLSYDAGHPEVRDAINALVDGRRLVERAESGHEGVFEPGRLGALSSTAAMRSAYPASYRKGRSI